MENSLLAAVLFCIVASETTAAERLSLLARASSNFLRALRYVSSTLLYLESNLSSSWLFIKVSACSSKALPSAMLTCANESKLIAGATSTTSATEGSLSLPPLHMAIIPPKTTMAATAAMIIVLLVPFFAVIGCDFLGIKSGDCWGVGSVGISSFGCPVTVAACESLIVSVTGDSVIGSSAAASVVLASSGLITIPCSLL